MSVLTLSLTTAQAQITYFWVGAPNANWSAPTSWATAAGGPRAQRLSTDVLTFSGGAPVATADISDEIGQLNFIDGTSATLNTLVNKDEIIRISGHSEGEDFVLGPGSTLSVIGQLSGGSNASLVFALGTGATASIAGAVTFGGSGGNNNADVNHQFRGPAGSIRFLTGGRLAVDDKVQNSPFEAVNGLAVFGAGSTFEQNAPASEDPYGAALFEKGSTYRFVAGKLGPTTTDRTYGNFVYASALTEVLTGPHALTILNDLSHTGSGTFTLSLTEPGTSIAGNVSVIDPGGMLVFDPNRIRAVSLVGTEPQTIAGAGILTFGNNAQLAINNTSAGGVTLRRPLTVRRGLRLVTGLLHTDAVNILTMPTTATVEVINGGTNTAGTSTSFVDGPLTRTTLSTAGAVPGNIGSGTGLFFPVGTPGAYRPVRLTLTQTAAQTTAYTAQVVLGPPPTREFPAPTATSIKRVSNVRYYSLTTGAVPNFTNGQITLFYGPDDEVDAPAKLRVARSEAGGAWQNLGGSKAVATAAPPYLTDLIASAAAADATDAPDAPFTALGTFALASVEAGNGAGTNPLPVELTHFSASAHSAGIELAWATASEKNSAYFDVQRSADGQHFERVAQVPGQGNSAAAHAYRTTDRAPLPGQAYYRLRQVDTDGRAAYSPVVSARWDGPTKLAVYPNPSNGPLYVSGMGGALQYRVFNTQGQALLAGATTGATGVNVRELPPGVYLLEIRTEAGRSTHRFVRQ